MLGRIFTEFFTLVEAEFGDDMLDDIIEDAELPNEGSYTAVGNYDYLELIRLVTALSERSHIGIPDLVKTFGTFIFERLVLIYPKLTENICDSFFSNISLNAKRAYQSNGDLRFPSSR